MAAQIMDVQVIDAIMKQVADMTLRGSKDTLELNVDD